MDGPPPPIPCAQHQVVLLSRYRDNLYICIMNAKTHQLPALKRLMSLLLHQIYGIKVKWESHTEDVVWGEGVLRSEGNHLTLHRKGVGLQNPETTLLEPASAGRTPTLR